MENTQIPDLDRIVLPTAAALGGIYFKNPGRMNRRATPELAGASHYHVMSRTGGGQKVFGDGEREAFRMLMWRMAKFAGIEVLTYCVMPNHFHLLARVPLKERFLKRFECAEPGGEGEQRLMKHLRLLYSEAYLAQLRGEMAELRDQGREAEVQALLGRYKRRFCDLSLFVKELKERYSRWYNKKYSQKGTLWMARFKSVLVQNGKCLQAVAAYIDLNPVRAGLVGRPEDYRWCGYSEALGGSKRMRRGLCRVVGWPIDNWELAGKREGKRGGSGGEAYREMLYERGVVDVGRDKKRRKSLDVEEVRNVIGERGYLKPGVLAQHRVRWFSEGVALGGERFLRTTLGESFEPSAFLELPVEAEEKGMPWWSLSRLRKVGIG